MTDPAPQDTGEFLALDNPNAALAEDNVRLREEVSRLRTTLNYRQQYVHARMHTTVVSGRGYTTDYSHCDMSTCRTTRALLAGLGP